MDFITHLPLCGGKATVLVVVDRLSKHGHLSPLGQNFTAPQVAKVFIQDIIKLHGFPSSIVSDRDPIFMSSFRKELFKLQGTTLSMSTAYHPQSNGQTESHKLSKRFFGPFRILERIGLVAYRLDLPEESHIHNVFHISVLKKCNGDPLSQQQPLPPHFIGWQQQHPSEATWEPLEDFRKDFPTFNLEDKVFLDAR
nr:retrotransposable element Tf2 [Tanacetum cinerariifolium]